MYNDEFAMILKEKRNNSGYNQAQLAALLFLSRSTYNHFESGLRLPSIDALIRISALYYINPMELINHLIPEDVLKEKPEYVKFIREQNYTLTSKELHFITKFSTLKENEMDAVMHVINAFNNCHCEIH